MKLLHAQLVEQFRNGTRRVMLASEPGTITARTKEGEVKLPFRAGDALLANEAGDVICGPLSLEGAIALASDILNGVERAATDPLALLALSTALIAFDQRMGSDSAFDDENAKSYREHAARPITDRDIANNPPALPGNPALVRQLEATTRELALSKKAGEILAERVTKEAAAYDDANARADRFAKALQAISDLRHGESENPFDDALAYADAALVEASPAPAARGLEDTTQRLAEAQRQAEHWHECFLVLEKAIVGNSGLSAVTLAISLRERAEKAETNLRHWREECGKHAGHANALRDRIANLQVDADRYRWLRDGNAYAPKEQRVDGGGALDELCDTGIAAASPPASTNER